VNPMNWNVSTRGKSIFKSGKYTTNGCGNSWYSVVMARIIQIVYRVNFKPACFWHDVERSIHPTLKSNDHRIHCDVCFALNMLQCLGDNPTDRQMKALTYFYTAVVANSFVTYWE